MRRCHTEAGLVLVKQAMDLGQWACSAVSTAVNPFFWNMFLRNAGVLIFTHVLGHSQFLCTASLTIQILCMHTPALNSEGALHPLCLVGWELSFLSFPLSIQHRIWHWGVSTKYGLSCPLASVNKHLDLPCLGHNPTAVSLCLCCSCILYGSLSLTLFLISPCPLGFIRPFRLLAPYDIL